MAINMTSEMQTAEPKQDISKHQADAKAAEEQFQMRVADAQQTMAEVQDRVDSLNHRLGLAMTELKAAKASYSELTGPQEGPGQNPIG